MSKVSTNLFFDPENRTLATRIFREHVAPYRLSFLRAMFFMVVAAISHSSLAYLLKPTIDNVFVNGNVSSLIAVCIAVFIATSVHGLSSFFESMLMATIGQNIITDLQNRLFAHLMHADLSYFHRTSSGDLLSRFISDIFLMRASVSNVIVGLGKDMVSLVCLIGVMFWCDWLLALIAFVILPTVVFPLARLSKRMRKATNNTQEEMATLTTQLTQVFQGMRLVKAYSMENYEIKQMHTITDRLRQFITKAIRIRASSHPAVTMVTGITTTAIIAYGGLQVMNGLRTPGEFIAFIAALAMSYEPLKRLSNTNASLQEGLTAATRVFATLDVKAEITSPAVTKAPETIKGAIVVKDLAFSYEGNAAILSNISLNIAPGQSIALVGASGSGKSTLINLIPRFYDVKGGQILIDGVDVRDWNLSHLRQQISLVSQEVTLFDDTVRNNIAYGRFNATEAEIIEAAKAAAAHDFIMRLPQKYDTIVGENGVKLSGGQRQRVSIARAMLKNAPILLLDEATSALDSHSEKQIQVTLNELMKGRTTIVVAHRLSTISNSDCIYVLDHGHIVENGTHQELIEKDGIYASLWDKQTTGIDIYDEPQQAEYLPQIKIS